MLKNPLVSIVLYALLSFTLPAFAAVTPFTATHTYVLGDDDSRNTARQKCLTEAKRKILEQVGVYLESYSELLTSSQSATAGSAKSPQTTNEERQQITEQITTLTAGIMKTEVIKEEFGEVNGRLQITLTVKAEVDPDDIQKQLAARRVDQGVRKQVTEQAQRLAQVEEQLRTMMEEMRSVGGAQPRGSEQQGKDPTVLDVAEIAAKIRARANKGDAVAQVWLGLRYEKGHGVPQDYDQARQWYEKAAVQGYAPAQSSLGGLYDGGLGVPQDYDQTRQWYEKAAAQGNALAQFQLGYLYAQGHGVPQDYVQAVKWYEKAASQGNGSAQFKLGMQYAQKGHGVLPNDVKAYMWLTLASANSTGTVQKLSKEARDLIARSLTPAQVLEAQWLASQCRAQKFKGC